MGDGEPVCIAEEVPFDLPDGWEWARLGGLITSCGGKTPSMLNTSYWETGTVPWVTSKDMKLRELYDSQMHITKLAADGMVTIPQNSVLLVTRSGILRRLLPVAINRMSTTINQDLKALIPIRPVVPEYLLYILQANDKNIRTMFHKDGTTVDSIDFSRLLGFLIPIPPLAEQQRIVAALDKYLALVDKIERNQEELESLLAKARSKVLDLAIRGKLVPQDPDDEPASVLLERIREEKLQMVAEGKLKKKDIARDSVIYKGEDNSYYEKVSDGELVCIAEEVPFELPAGWEWTRLITLCYPQERPEFNGETFKYIDIDSIDNKRNIVRQPKSVATKEAPSRANRKLRTGSTLFSMVRPYLRNIAYIDTTLSDCVASTGFYVASPISDNPVGQWLFLCMRSEYFVSTINKQMKGDNSPSVRNNEGDAMLIPLPCKREQERILCIAKSVLTLSGIY